MFLLCLAGTAFSYVLLAIADTVAMLLASRLVAGLMAGMGAPIFAAVTDLTEPGPERAKHMGRVGASIGVGFMLGPALGGLLAGSSAANANFVLIALVAGGLDLLALAITAVAFKESLAERQRDYSFALRNVDWGRPRRFLLHTPFVALSAAHLLFTGAYAVLESTLPLLANRAHDLSPQEIGYLFTWMAAASVLTQSFLVEPLVKGLGDRGAVLFGIAGYFVAFIVLASATGFVTLGIGLTCTSLAWAGFLGPSSNLVAAMAEPGERGLALGLFQAAGNLGRVITPLLSGVLFVNVGMASPFFFAALSMVPAFWLAMLAKPVPLGAASKQTPRS